MGAPGSPTTRRRMPRPEGESRPRFTDRLPEDFTRPDINPFLVAHREHGHPLLPASEAWPYRGRWHEAFGREAPLHVEIGSGNGFFLAELARRNPDWNVLGIEIRYKRTVLCAKKIEAAGVSNALITRYDAWYLDDLFEDGSLAGLYVNHPDPWPKVRHEKNRLLSLQPIITRTLLHSIKGGPQVVEFILKRGECGLEVGLSECEGFPLR